MALRFGEQTYRSGAKERLEEARRLLEQKYLSGSVYLAGRAVEGMLRGLLWLKDDAYRTGRKTLTARHDLRKLLIEVRRLGLLSRPGPDDQFMQDIQYIARLWANNLRFASTQQLKRHWQDIGEVKPKRTMKRAAEDYVNVCFKVVRRCEKLWPQ